MNPPLCNAPLFWAPNRRVQNANSLTLPRRMLMKKRVVRQVHWTPRSMLAWARRRKPLGTRPSHPLLRGAAEGIAPCEGSIPGRIKNFEGPKQGALVFHCFRKPLKRMPFPIEIGVARSRTPWSQATMLPRSKKRCLRPWRGWPGTMPR